MKMYEKLGLNLNGPEMLKKIYKMKCTDIPDKEGLNWGPESGCYYEGQCKDCTECKIDRLFKDVPLKKVKRWETITSDNDVRNLWDAFRYKTDLVTLDVVENGFVRFLCEVIEVEE